MRNSIVSRHPVASAGWGSDWPESAAEFVAAAAAVLRQWQHRVRTRQHLAEMDDRMLSDIGISRIDAIREAEKPFWQE